MPQIDFYLLRATRSLTHVVASATRQGVARWGKFATVAYDVPSIRNPERDNIFLRSLACLQEFLHA
jgi:hypothetical protein